MKIAAILLTLVFAAVICAAQETPATESKKDKAASTSAKKGETRWEGHIIRINKDTSSVSVRGGRSGKENFEREIFYDSSTKWTKQGKAADQSEFKEGSFVIAVGKPDDKGNFHADRIDLRLPR
jgi:hypothetical protein